MPGKYESLKIGDFDVIIETREDNAKQIANSMNQAMAKALSEIGLMAEGYAKQQCPVDTGRLRNSITNTLNVEGKEVYIGTNVEYAPYVELGTSSQKAQPFLRPAAADHANQYRSILEAEMKKG